MEQIHDIALHQCPICEQRAMVSDRHCAARIALAKSVLSCRGPISIADIMDDQDDEEATRAAKMVHELLSCLRCEQNPQREYFMKLTNDDLLRARQALPLDRDKVIPAHAFAKMIGVSRQTLTNWVHRFGLPYFQAGPQAQGLIPVGPAIRWIEERMKGDWSEGEGGEVNG